MCVSKTEREEGGRGGGEEEEGDLYGVKSTVTGREREEGKIYTLQGEKTWDRARE